MQLNGIINLELLIMLFSIIPIDFFQNIYLNVQTSTFAKFITDINLFEIIITAISQNKAINIINNLI